MCEQGDVTEINNNHVLMSVDSCLATLIGVLNVTGFRTVASCCGHGKRPGNIALEDGREIIIVPDYKTSRRVERLMGWSLDELEVQSDGE